ncbi:MAG TPA: FkbM family methyltransferase, partial [Spirochaetia bacterium]|nr:FkbM family methyltransferase [Spirochaetia bacterium]
MKNHLDHLSREAAIVTAKADAMYDSSRPGFIHALRRKDAHERWTELSFPDGFVCNTNSSPIETELEYNDVVVMQEYLRTGISVSDGDTVVDVGANVGIFAMHLLRSVQDLAIHAIEPVPDTFDVLKSNTARYPHRSVYLHNIAIGAGEDSTLEIVLYPHLTGNATACPEVTQTQRESLSGHLTAEEIAYLYTEERVTVPCTTLSSFFRTHSIEHIDLLKIDTEGSE